MRVDFTYPNWRRHLWWALKRALARMGLVPLVLLDGVPQRGVRVFDTRRGWILRCVLDERGEKQLCPHCRAVPLTESCRGRVTLGIARR